MQFQWKTSITHLSMGLVYRAFLMENCRSGIKQRIFKENEMTRRDRHSDISESRQRTVNQFASSESAAFTP